MQGLHRAVIALAGAAFAGAVASDDSFDFSNSLPLNPPWTLQGVVLSEVEGTRAVDFHDESTEDVTRIDCEIPKSLAEEMSSKGFTLRVRMKTVAQGESGHNFSVTVRLPGFNPMYFVQELPSESGVMRCWTTNELTGQTIRGKTDSSGFVDYELTYEPGEQGETGAGVVNVSANQRIILQTTATLNPEVGDKRAITLGGPTPERTGRTLVESVQLLTP